MPRVQASIALPYLLKLKSGMYSAGRREDDLEVNVPSFHPDVQPRTVASIVTDQPATLDENEQRYLNSRQADRLLSLTNRLLRCYRATTRDPAIVELSRASASPFRFVVVLEGTITSAKWESELSYPVDPPKVLSLKSQTISSRVRALLKSGKEPAVSVLFLLDGQQALHEGRFREAVLFSWSTIDSTFNQKYDDLVDAKLAEEWAEAREFFKGVDFGLRKKMSAALYLVSGRSLFRESKDLWEQISVSYNKRNGIIHRGENATEDDARRALAVGAALSSS